MTSSALESCSTISRFVMGHFIGTLICYHAFRWSYNLSCVYGQLIGSNVSSASHHFSYFLCTLFHFLPYNPHVCTGILIYLNINHPGSCDFMVAKFKIVSISALVGSLTHFIPSPQPTRDYALPRCLPILASQKPAEIGSSLITVFHLPLLCDFSILFTRTYYDCYHIYIKGKLTK